MQHADTLTVVHHDDSRTRYRNVRYALHRHGVRILTDTGEHFVTDVLTTYAYRATAAKSTALADATVAEATALVHDAALAEDARLAEDAALAEDARLAEDAALAEKAA
jgi:hypothetical protein